MSNTDKRSVVITGASAGVGRATAQEFAKLGSNVALIARGEGGLQAAAKDVEAAGGKALALPLDVADAEKVMGAADRIAAEWGKIDVWINCAMVTIFAPVSRISPAEFRRVTEVTYLGQVHGTMAALKHMRSRDKGTIVQVGSALSYRAIPLQSAYCIIPGIHQGKESKGSVPKPAKPIIPIPAPTQLLWKRCRGGRNNSARLPVSEGFQRDQ